MNATPEFADEHANPDSLKTFFDRTLLPRVYMLVNGQTEKTAEPPRSARADELQRELAKSTDFRRHHIDEGILERKAYLRKIIQTGSEEEFREALKVCGVNEDSAEGKELLSAFRKFREI